MGGEGGASWAARPPAPAQPHGEQEHRQRMLGALSTTVHCQAIAMQCDSPGLTKASTAPQGHSATNTQSGRACAWDAGKPLQGRGVEG